MPEEVPTVGQLVLLMFAIVAFAVGGLISVARLRGDRPGFRLAAKACLYAGLVLCVSVLIWHSIWRGSWIPIEDNFDAFVWLAVLLTGFVLYIQRFKPLGGLDWFVMPVTILLLIAAGVFGRAKPHEYINTTWHWTHRVTSYTGTVAFVIAGVAGVMYLLKLRQLKSRQPETDLKLGSLERLEHITFNAVTLGFALLTIGLVTGLVRVLTHHGSTTLGSNWLASPKVLFSIAVWLVYAVVLHAPINPSFRGRKAAILSVCGLVLTIGAIIATQFVPSGGTR